MFIFDISDEIRSRDITTHTERKIFIQTKTELNEDRKIRRGKPYHDVYVLSEEWSTPEGDGHTGDWEFYKFLNLSEARTFIAELAIKLNTPGQRALLYTMEEFANWITEDYKQFSKQEKKRTDKLQSLPKKKRPPFKDKLIEQIQQQQSTIPTGYSQGRKLVYVFNMGNGTVKIGITNNVAERRRTIMFSSGLFIAQFCQTQLLPEKEAMLVESTCHTHFDDRRVLGEFFRVPYQEAKEFLASISSIAEITP